MLIGGDRMNRNNAYMLGVVAAGLLVGGPAQAQGTPDSFQLPSGRLHCQYQAADVQAKLPATVRCDVQGATFKAPPRGDCSLDFGDSLALPAAGRPVWACHGDTVMNPQNPVLAYGKTWTKGSLTCSSATTGLRCVNRSGHGFELARSRYRLF